MRDTGRGPDDISHTAQVENILRTTNKLFNLDNRRSKAFSRHDLERYYIKTSAHSTAIALLILRFFQECPEHKQCQS